MYYYLKCVILLFVFCGSGGAQMGCPPLEEILPCRCLLRGAEFQIWCSHSDLPRVLEGLRAIGKYITQPIDELILENNYLPSLPGRAFLPLKVMRLMLRHNGLEQVSSDWLTGLENSLMELFIVEPDLRSLPEDSLFQINAVEAITIESNLLKRLPLISGLPKLRHLQVESKSLIELSPRNFKDNPALEKLHITMSPRLTRLEANLLRDLPSLNLVNISFCGLTWLHPRALSNLPNLKELSLVGNRIVDAGMIGRGSRDLLQLEIIRLDHNYVDKLGEAAFVDLPTLKKVYLSNNRITELHHGAFHRVPMLRSLDLNRNMVRRVHPESFLQHSGSGLQELWLVENDISHVAELRSLLDALPRLTFLDMSYNNLEAIPFGALRGHPTLEYLHLDYNKIHLIDREAFVAMPALRELRLKNNSLSDMLEGPLWNLPALKGLDLSGNYFRRLDPGILLNLPSLRKVDLSSNELTFIDPTAFLLNIDLEHVNLSHNALATIHPGTFRHLLNLYELDVGNNKLVEFVPGLPRGIEYLHMQRNQINDFPILPSPDLDLPSLRMLDISYNAIQRLNQDSLRTLPQLRRLYIGNNLLQEVLDTSLKGLSRLEVLDIADNRVIHLDPNALKEIAELKELNLKNNRLDILIPDVFKNARRLKRLDVSRNQLSEILPGTLDKNRELQYFDASYNTIVKLSPTFYGMKNLQVLDLTNNRIKNIDPEILNSLENLRELKITKNFIQELKQGTFNDLQHLKILHLDNNEIEYIEPNSIRSLPVLKSIVLSQNKLKEIPNNAFNNLPSLQVAELQENEIRTIAPKAFNSVPHLLMLNLSNNYISSIEEAGLRGIRSLELLDVSKNKLSRVSGQTLEKLEWLVELRMDDNKICGIQGSFNRMSRLKVLSMKNNKIMSFPEKAVQRLRGTIDVLDIDGNPLACSCNLLWMHAWLEESASKGPRCLDGGLLKDMRLSRQDCDEEERNLDVVAPGCEAELLSAPGMYGTSQVFSPWMRLKSQNVSKEHKNNLAPSPEESDYFYDEYVDYPYNESAVIEPNNGQNKKHIMDSINVKPETTLKANHNTPGYTPTLYAGLRNKTRPEIPKTVLNSPSSSGFTFFGVPLPSLNFNKILGGTINRITEKKTTPNIAVAERKTAIVNKPNPNVRLGMVPPLQNSQSSSVNHVLKPPNMLLPNALPQNMYPPVPQGSHMMLPDMPNFPEIQTGGFKPILPGTGGFTPILNPNLKRLNTSVEVIKANVTDLSEISSIDASNIVTTSVQNDSKGFEAKKSEIAEDKPNRLNLKMGEELDQKQISSVQEGIPEQEKYISNTERTVLQSHIEIASDEKENTETVTEMVLADSVIPTEQNVAETTKKQEITNIEEVKNVEEPEIITTEQPETNLTEIKGETSANQIKQPVYARRNGEQKQEGTSLSALLVPGGQQPYFRPAGRSSISKVPSPHSTLGKREEKAEKNVDGDKIPELLPHPHNREGKNSHEITPLKEEFNSQVREESNWYFANYNKTNLDPYIGKSTANGRSFNSASDSFKYNKKVFYLLLALNVFFKLV